MSFVLGFNTSLVKIKTMKNLNKLLFIAILFISNTCFAQVVINELLAFNTSLDTDQAGEHEDWIELFNTSATNSVDLSGCYISDKIDFIDKWQFPQGTIIEPKGYLILWCDEDSDQGPYHINFKLSSTLGELVLLSDSNLNELDFVQFDPQVADISYGRYPNGTGSFNTLFNPTMGSSNGGDLNILEHENKIDFHVNPVSELIHVASNQEIEICLYNIYGQKLFSGKYNQPFDINTSQLNSGLYILSLNDKIHKLIL